MPAHSKAGSVLLANPHPRLFDGLRGLLEASFEQVFMVADAPSLIEGARKLQPALAVVDLSLAAGRLGPLLAEVRTAAPRTRTLLLSDHDDAHVDAAALVAGADGIVCKARLAADLFDAVDAVLAGRRFSSPSARAEHRSGNR
ncbi:MAG TPA: response regulator [Rubrivivax sp.]|nr:response regulator [Rubrivivax sp.]